MRFARDRRGFTLLEVLVATTLMAIAVGAIFGTLTTSMRSAARVTEHDRAALQAQRILDEIQVDWNLPRGEILGGPLVLARDGMDGRWQARIETVETGAGAGRNRALDRVAVEVLWQTSAGPRTLQLEGYRMVRTR
jgi:general secretion pathway protein I